jgi:hypothetical protein
LKLSRVLLLVFAILLSLYVDAQEKQLGIHLSNNTPSFPVLGYPGVFYSGFHPGLDIQYHRKLNNKEKNEFYLRLQSGIFYQRFVQTLVYALPGIHYRYHLHKNFALESTLSLGSAAAFEGVAVARLNANGEYEVVNKFIPRAQYVFALNNGVSYAFKKEDREKFRVIFQLQTMLQGTFVKGYVPVLPINSVLIGFRYPLKKSGNE